MSNQSIETYCATTDLTVSMPHSTNAYSIKSFIYNCWQTMDLESVCDMLLNRKTSRDITIRTLIPIKTHFLGLGAVDQMQGLEYSRQVLRSETVFEQGAM